MTTLLPPPPRPRPSARPSLSRVRPRKPHAAWLYRLSWVNLTGVLAVWAFVAGLSEDWWISTALVYLPRSPYLLPSLVLAPWCWRQCRQAVWINAVAAVIVLGPLMGLELNVRGLPFVRPDSPGKNPFCVVSCNVQGFVPRFGVVLQELATARPAVVAFQEYHADEPLLAAWFRDWQWADSGEFFVAARHPVRLIAVCESVAFDRPTVAVFEIDDPAGRFRVFNVHQTSPRHSLTNLKVHSLVTDAGESTVARQAVLRQEESLLTRSFVDDYAAGLPYVVVGDFNMPTDSSLFRTAWGDLTETFQAAGLGYGYTSPCKSRNLWPVNTPWARVDHILTSPAWDVRRAWIGRHDGSDHRLIAAIIDSH